MTKTVSVNDKDGLLKDLPSYTQDAILAPESEGVLTMAEALPATPSAPSPPPMATASAQSRHPTGPTQSILLDSEAARVAASYLPAAPTTSGLVVRRFPGATLAQYGELIPYAAHQEATRVSGNQWYPAQSESEWRLLKILFKSGLSNAWINEILSLKMVCQLNVQHTNPSLRMD